MTESFLKNLELARVEVREGHRNSPAQQKWALDNLKKKEAYMAQQLALEDHDY